MVRGPLHFEREVDLYLGEGATIGKLEGMVPRTNRMPWQDASAPIDAPRLLDLVRHRRAQ